MWIIIEEHEMFCVEGGEEGSSGHFLALGNVLLSDRL